MLIKSLRMKNFRQFKDDTKIEFACSPEKNVTIILGDNTYGKTTLLQAFNWCLYGKAIFDKNSDFLMNYEVADRLHENEEKVVEVEIEIISKGIEYLINRKQSYKYVGRKVVGASNSNLSISYKDEDGQEKAVKGIDVDKVINEILPEELSTYFFFDTERVNSISTRKDVSNSVKGLLGLSALESAIKHLGGKSRGNSVIGQLNDSLDLHGDQDAQKARDRMHTAEQKLEQIKIEIKECEDQIKQYEDRNEQLKEILRRNETTRQLQKQKENLEKLVKSENIRIEKEKKRYLREFNSSSMPFFVQPLIKEAKSFLIEAKVDDKGVQDLTSATINELIERGRCICGQEIKDGNEAYKHLMEELKYVPPQSIGTSVRFYRQKLDQFSDSAESIFDNIQDSYDAIDQSRTNIQNWEYEIEVISEKIKGSENMKQYEDELQRNRKRLNELNLKKNKLMKDSGGEERIIKQCEKICDSHSPASSKNKKIREWINYAEEIKEWLDEKYKEKDQEIRKNLETEVNKIFEQMYHGHRRVVIDRRYNVELLSTISDHEIATGESEGTNRVKNFAFIAGLVALAKNKITTDNQNPDESFDLSSEPYPLMMDAPFSNTDEIHTANISKVLPEVAEQVIMFVMQKDWRYAEPVLNERVGKKFYLNKISETYTQLIGE